MCLAVPLLYVQLWIVQCVQRQRGFIDINTFPDSAQGLLCVEQDIKLYTLARLGQLLHISTASHVSVYRLNPGFHYPS